MRGIRASRRAPPLGELRPSQGATRTCFGSATPTLVLVLARRSAVSRLLERLPLVLGIEEIGADAGYRSHASGAEWSVLLAAAGASWPRWP